ncbi:hypothetical protein RHGRI_002898 [Rhododendron griersonianum]|uniref:F-box domain-containing protein n=1 Tax=Rhododendron griersonianum TaxID=479676 RepID=A0AAV6LRE2_9ERIC|nr:hypothetical protein RHGRI_002898 [Rhododendron griersonianum]
MNTRQPHPVTPNGVASPLSFSDPKRGKKRGGYNCGRCGLPKRGHTCHIPAASTTPTESNSSSAAVAASPVSVVRPPSPPRRSAETYSVLRRELSFDHIDVRDSVSSDDEEEVEEEEESAPDPILWDVLRRLPPPALLSAAKVCKGWRDTARRIWRAAEELRLRVPASAQVGSVGSVLQKCSVLVRLSLRMESDVDATMLACIAFSCPNLQSMEIFTSNTSTNRITGSTISDSGIGMICNVFPETLSKLLLALCPNITSSGIQFAAAQLPLLELMDCGMTICDPNSQSSISPENDWELQNTANSKLSLIYQKLIIKHGKLKKLSLWGCSGLDALYLNCPQLNDLNLNSCRNLHPERLLLQCPNLGSVHASGCQDMLVETIQNEVRSETAALENHFTSKRSADGSKRVRVPHFLSYQVILIE